jgi:ribosomal protein L14E/L6E/L27E
METGPFKLNGVPVRRVNQAYTIATSTRIDVKGINTDAFTDAWFASVEKAAKKGDFVKAGEKAAVRFHTTRLDTLIHTHSYTFIHIHTYAL